MFICYITVQLFSNTFNTTKYAYMSRCRGAKNFSLNPAVWGQERNISMSLLETLLRETRYVQEVMTLYEIGHYFVDI